MIGDVSVGDEGRNFFEVPHVANKQCSSSLMRRALFRMQRAGRTGQSLESACRVWEMDLPLFRVFWVHCRICTKAILEAPSSVDHD